MARLGVLDGLRGACIVFMALTHMKFGREYLLGHLHFHELGFADSAQAFIFLSGFLVGLVGMRVELRQGGLAALRRYGRRASTLYGCHLLLLLMALLASRLLPGSGAAWGPWLGHLLDDGLAYPIAAGLFLYQPTYLDILPQYLLYLLAAPLLLRLLARGHEGAVLGVSLGLWLAAQLGLQAPLLRALQPFLASDGGEVALRAYFNPLGWQLVFTGGLVLGALVERGALRRELLLGRAGTAGAQLAGTFLTGLALLRLALDGGLLDAEALQRFGMLERRGDLGPLVALDFAALAYLVAWLLVAGPAAASPAVRRLASALATSLAQPWLARLGRHSLAVFVCHVILVYAFRYLDVGLGPIPDPWFSLIAAGLIASLALPATALDLRRRTPPPASSRAEPSLVPR